MNKTSYLQRFFAIFFNFFWISLGSFFAAAALEIFLIPNQIIDGGVVGVSILFSEIFGKELLAIFLLLFNLPFLYLAYRNLGKSFLTQMALSILMLAYFIFILQGTKPYIGEAVEVIFCGGLLLGFGIGLIIRKGGALDGSEIVGILLNRMMGFTVGQVVLFFNIFIFALAGCLYNNWHTAVQSLMTYVVAIKMMDMVIVGLEETKAVLIISSKAKEISQSIMHDLGLGCTILYGRGGFSGEDQELLYVIVERLQIAELKELIGSKDPKACMAIENLHEVVNGRYDLAAIEKQQQSILYKPLRRLWKKSKLHL